MFKKGFIILIFILFITLASCSKDTTIEDPVLPDSIEEIQGLDNIEVTQNEYFDPLKNVEIINQNGDNISYMLEVKGSVNYGKLGSYTLTYEMAYGEDTISQERIVTVNAGTINRETMIRNFSTETKITQAEGSYRLGVASDIDHPINPQLINQDLLETAVPSNGWWTSLLAVNYGGGNGIYTNPLRSAFSNEGAEITNPGTGFVQYWNPDGLNTMANFSLALPDMFLKTSTLNQGYETHVIGYSDTNVKVAMRNVSDKKDHMVLTYTQGSPYVFAEVMDESSPYITLGVNGVDSFSFYSVDGIPISSNTYIGSGIIIKFVHKHVGYDTYQPAQVGQPIYADRYFLVSTPEDTNFDLASVANRISLDLGNQNYYSVAAIQSISEATFFHDHAYTKPLEGNVSYDIDYENSLVETNFQLATQYLSSDNQNETIQFLMPHHYQNSTHELTSYSFETTRGELKAMIGSSFTTSLIFNGVLPSMPLPTDDAFNSTDMLSYLNDLNLNTQIEDSSNFLNDEGPYWNGKAIYPLAQGIIISDQLGNNSLKNEFIAKLKYVLSDWFTYSSSSDERYLYYNEAWGTVYYSNNDFNTASEMSDHSFTHGYLTYASGVLAMYDETFTEEYGDMVSLLLNDYMYPEKDSYDFEYLRSFDPWAGHTWAHGFGTFAEGNNIESSSEALQSWIGGYLWAQETGDTKLRDAAIYGFVSELNAAKAYMFDYSQTIFPSKYSDYASVASMIWGGKYDYATWFGANPTFIYGIQWLPNGEYLSNYATNEDELTRLNHIYQSYLSAKNQTIDTWYANMWSIQAILNPTTAISQFDATKILTDDYPNDLSQTYYLIHGLNTYGRKTDSYHMEIHQYVASSIYKDSSGKITALIWNSSSDEQTVNFIDPTGIKISKKIDGNSFIAVDLT
ncbi:MAG: hypothetical protein JXC31_00225 [Acholeplasmataceae bacterium]|nr:hypothetical protein [Acholeplasmataceae bacterium]